MENALEVFNVFFLRLFFCLFFTEVLDRSVMEFALELFNDLFFVFLLFIFH
jgi:hypothetical protein